MLSKKIELFKPMGSLLGLHNAIFTCGCYSLAVDIQCTTACVYFHKRPFTNPSYWTCGQEFIKLIHYGDFFSVSQSSQLLTIIGGLSCYTDVNTVVNTWLWVVIYRCRICTSMF